MEHNVCETCGAKDGRAGLLLQQSKDMPNECINCYDTRGQKKVIIHTHLTRTEEEIKKTAAILK